MAFYKSHDYVMFLWVWEMHHGRSARCVKVKHDQVSGKKFIGDLSRSILSDKRKSTLNQFLMFHVSFVRCLLEQCPQMVKSCPLFIEKGCQGSISVHYLSDLLLRFRLSKLIR